MRPDSMHSAPGRIRQNLGSIRGRIEAARTRGPHAAAAVELVVVTKSVEPTLFGALDEAGVRTVGENRVLSVARRRRLAPARWTWHGIGHLQRNKARTATEVFDVFEALDSVRLARHLDRLMAGRAAPWPVYLQVNAAGDDAKGGLPPDRALDALREIETLGSLRPLGFMTMAKWGAEEGDLRATFRTLRQIRDEAQRLGLGGAGAAGLSMGMSDDFEIAVEEGATTVRVGRAVFEGVENERTPVSPSQAEPGSTEEHA